MDISVTIENDFRSYSLKHICSLVKFSPPRYVLYMLFVKLSFIGYKYYH